MDEQPTAVQSLNIQKLFAKQQNPSFLSLDDEELQMLDHSDSASAKQADLWNKVISNQKKGKFPMAALALTADLESTFKHEGDVFAWDNWKLSHNVGATGKVKFVRKGSKAYTGIFQGADYGLVRFSTPLEPSKKQALIPSFGLKFLRDGVDSANLVS